MSEYLALIQFFVVAPVCQFLLTPSRVNHNSRRRGLVYAVFFLLLTCLLLTAFQLSTSPTSYYSLLNSPITATSADLRRAYKAAAIRLHPDKNPTPSAADEFTLLTKAHDILQNAEHRSLYDRHGPAAAEYAASHPSTGQWMNQAMFDAGLWYLMWGGLTYVLCMGKAAVMGRNIAWTLLFLTALAEYHLVLRQWDPLTSLFPHTPAFEKVQFLRALYPSLMNAARLLSQFLFVDRDALHFALMRDVLASNVLILSTLRQVQATVERGGVGGGVVGEGREDVDDGTGTGALPSHLRLRNEESRIARLQGQLVEGGSGGKRGLPSWVIPVGLFVLANWLGRGGGGSGGRSA